MACNTCRYKNDLPCYLSAIGISSDTKCNNYTLQLRSLNARWTLEMAQDMTSLFSINIQEELVRVMAQEMATSIDREIITHYQEDTTRRTNLEKELIESVKRLAESLDYKEPRRIRLRKK